MKTSLLSNLSIVAIALGLAFGGQNAMADKHHDDHKKDHGKGGDARTQHGNPQHSASSGHSSRGGGDHHERHSPAHVASAPHHSAGNVGRGRPSPPVHHSSNVAASSHHEAPRVARHSDHFSSRGHHTEYVQRDAHHQLDRGHSYGRGYGNDEYYAAPRYYGPTYSEEYVTPAPQLHYGERNVDSDTRVAVQEELARAGYYRGDIDGVMGLGTQSAIAAYQRDNGLRVNGVITDSLLNSLGVN